MLRQNRDCGRVEKVRRRDVCGERGHARAKWRRRLGLEAEVRGGGASSRFCLPTLCRLTEFDTEREKGCRGEIVSERTKCSKPPVDVELSSNDERGVAELQSRRRRVTSLLFVAERPVIFGQWGILDRSTLSVIWCVEEQQYGKLRLSKGQHHLQHIHGVPLSITWAGCGRQHNNN